jgi:hypothetical protein
VSDAPDPPLSEPIHLTGIPDRVAAEALALEIRRLARAHGLEVGEIRITRGAADPAPSANAV